MRWSIAVIVLIHIHILSHMDLVEALVHLVVTGRHLVLSTHHIQTAQTLVQNTPAEIHGSLNKFTMFQLLHSHSFLEFAVILGLVSLVHLHGSVVLIELTSVQILIALVLKRGARAVVVGVGIHFWMMIFQLNLMPM